MSARPATTVQLSGHGAQPVRFVQQLSLDGVILAVAGPLVVGQWLTAHLAQVGLAAPLGTDARVVWCRALEGTLYAGLEFVGSWGALTGFRRGLAAALGSRALAGERLVGYVVPEEPGLACFDPQTAKVAVVVPAEGSGYRVRRRDGAADVPRLGRALASGLGSEQPLRLDPPLPGLEPPEQGPGDDSAAGAGADRESEALQAARTVVLRPGEDDALSEAEILGANTLVLGPERLPRGSSTGRTTEATVVLPGARKPSGRSPRPEPQPQASPGTSDLVLAGRVVGRVTATAESCWSVYDAEGAKAAMIMAEGPQLFRVCTLAGESLGYVDAKSARGALKVALELKAEPTVDPPMPGLS